MHQLDKAAKPLSPCFGEFVSQIGPSAFAAPVPSVHIRPSQTAGGGGGGVNAPAR